MQKLLAQPISKPSLRFAFSLNFQNVRITIIPSTSPVRWCCRLHFQMWTLPIQQNPSQIGLIVYCSNSSSSFFLLFVENSMKEFKLEPKRYSKCVLSYTCVLDENDKRGTNIWNAVPDEYAICHFERRSVCCVQRTSLFSVQMHLSFRLSNGVSCQTSYFTVSPRSFCSIFFLYAFRNKFDFIVWMLSAKKNSISLVLHCNNNVGKISNQNCS